MNDSSQISQDDPAPGIEKLVPSQSAYIAAYSVLALSGIAGGLIGYAMMKVFFTDISGAGLYVGTLIICACIIYGTSVITSLGLQASVEWKARKPTSRQRPSKDVKNSSSL